MVIRVKPAGSKLMMIAALNAVIPGIAGKQVPAPPTLASFTLNSRLP